MTTQLREITAIQHKGMYQPPMGKPCWHTVADAADAMDVTESEIIAAIRNLTKVRTIEGPAVAGMVELQAGHGETGYLPYYR